MRTENYPVSSFELLLDPKIKIRNPALLEAVSQLSCIYFHFNLKSAFISLVKNLLVKTQQDRTFIKNLSEKSIFLLGKLNLLESDSQFLSKLLSDFLLSNLSLKELKKEARKGLKLLKTEFHFLKIFLNLLNTDMSSTYMSNLFSKVHENISNLFSDEILHYLHPKLFAFGTNILTQLAEKLLDCSIHLGHESLIFARSLTPESVRYLSRNKAEENYNFFCKFLKHVRTRSDTILRLVAIRLYIVSFLWFIIILIARNSSRCPVWLSIFFQSNSFRLFFGLFQKKTLGFSL